MSNDSSHSSHERVQITASKNADGTRGGDSRSLLAELRVKVDELTEKNASLQRTMKVERLVSVPRDTTFAVPQPATARPTSPPKRKNIFLVDDHPLLRRGLVELIESEPDLTVSG